MLEKDWFILTVKERTAEKVKGLDPRQEFDCGKRAGRSVPSAGARSNPKSP